MRKRKRLFGVLLMIAALVIMTLPVSEADAASSASDFVIEGGTLVRYQGTEKTVSVPDTVEVIGESAFENKTAIEKVVLPASVTTIEPYAFWGCDSLATLVTGKGLTSIGDYAFAGCKGLKEMSLSSKVTSIGIQAFADCVNLTDITIPEETTQIHESAFDGCARLTIHCREGSAADYYARAFYERQKEMPEYEDVPDYGETAEEPEETGEPQTTEPPLVTEPPYVVEGEVLGTTQIVGNSAFFLVDAERLQPRQETAQLQLEERISVSEAIPKYTLVDGRIVADQAYYRSARFTELELPRGIEEIGQFAFARSTVEKAVIPDGVKEIAYGAFYHCDGLREVTLPETIESVEPKAFTNTGWVEDFLTGGSVEAFLISGGVLIAYAGNETDVSIPDGVRVIAAEAFLGHAEIEALRLPDSLRVIGEAAFEGCTGLREIRLNQGLEQIKDRAFCGVAGADVSIPSSVKSIGLRALEGMTVKYEGEQPEQSHEVSAERLSNEAYRAPVTETRSAGVRVVTEGISGEAYASLEGAARYYELSVRREESSEQMEKAWRRVYEEPLPEELLLYEMELSDNSGIPISKLGHQRLSLTLPLSEEYRGQELKAVGLDRNGQLVSIDAERVLMEGEECLCLSMTQLSTLGIYCVGEASDEPLQSVSVTVQAGAPPLTAEAEEETGNGFPVRRALGCVMLLTGGALCLPGGLRRRT